ncbi:family 43 glycosylhydrolase [Bacteroidales bacterium]|nr:family 43 glycosylhydrolase [Bacteroidales bacterium]
MKKYIFLILTNLLTGLVIAQEKKITYPYTWTTDKNPVVKHIYACDPSAKVFSDGTVWVFASRDGDNAKSYKGMVRYHFLSTKDMKTWTDHGEALSLDDISWADKNLWAPDACERNGKYYLYAPAGHNIGVFVSDKPEGPYKDALGKPLIPFSESIDPSVFIDDDGQAYLYFSRRGTFCYVVKLKENMIEMDGPIHELTNISLRSFKDGDFVFVEGPYVHKRNGIYYMSYPAKRYLHGSKGMRNNTGDEVLCYAMSENPMGPFKYAGQLTKESGVHTIHQSIIEFEGESYLFYHNGELAKSRGHEEYGMYRRSMCINKITYNEDGTINFMEQTEGVFD